MPAVKIASNVPGDASSPSDTAWLGNGLLLDDEPTTAHPTPGAGGRGQPAPPGPAGVESSAPPPQAACDVQLSSRAGDAAGARVEPRTGQPPTSVADGMRAGQRCSLVLAPPPPASTWLACGRLGAGMDRARWRLADFQIEGLLLQTAGAAVYKVGATATAAPCCRRTDAG